MEVRVKFRKRTSSNLKLHLEWPHKQVPDTYRKQSSDSTCLKKLKTSKKEEKKTSYKNVRTVIFWFQRERETSYEISKRSRSVSAIRISEYVEFWILRYNMSLEEKMFYTYTLSLDVMFQTELARDWLGSKWTIIIFFVCVFSNINSYFAHFSLFKFISQIGVKIIYICLHNNELNFLMSLSY